VLRQYAILAISGSPNTKALSKFVKELVAEDRSAGAGSRTEEPRYAGCRAGFVSYNTALVRAQRGSQSILSSEAFVAMMQSADFPDLNDPAGL
jgi:hypothetical protein